MRAIWLHSFPASVADAGSFMYPLAEGMTSAGVDIVWVRLENLRSPWGILRGIRRVRAIASKGAVVHAQYGSGCGLIAAFAPGKRVLTLRGSDWYGNGPTSGVGSLLRSRITVWITRMTLGRFNLIVCMSDRMAAEVRRAAGRVPVMVLPDAIDLQAFRPIDRAAARAALGHTNDERPWVLFPSFNGYRPVKRPELAAATLREVTARGIQAHLHAIANVPKQDMPVHISACDVILVTSTHEGWPNIVKEGLACGVPFVSTDVSDLARIARVHKSCAVCPPSPAALADALIRAFEGGRDPTLRACVEPMAPSLASDQLMMAYQELLENAQ